MSISFFVEQVDFTFKRRNIVKAWIKDVVLNENKKLGKINVIFTSNKYILEINQKYLDHHYFTDVITFNYNKGIEVSGDIFISIDTINTNSKLYEVSFENELSRVIIHGILHLLGYNDKSKSEQTLMKEKEDLYLRLI